MNRRDVLKSLGLGAAAAVALPAQFDTPAIRSLEPTYYTMDKSAFVTMRARRGLSLGDPVDVNGRFLGVAVTPARAGEWVSVQVYGPMRVKIA